MKSRYPKTWKYLSRNRDRLEDRSGVNKETWWQYGRPQNLDKFETEKLMTQVLAAESSFSIDKDGSYVFVGGGNAGGYGVVLSSSAGVSYESLLAILNSSLLEWTLQKESSQFRGGYYSYARRFIEKLPVRSWVEDCWSVLSSSWKSQQARVTRPRHPTNDDANQDIRLGASRRESASTDSLA
ncbi:TaqI-like C-terminal specificity domain-containing protein [Halobacterium salinarum]|uniref:TaqI-like C-terminal specificity domain-containing protein n=1 Tax=Halobacterium salinarum TaxID=2242 RepID=UPI003D77996E